MTAACIPFEKIEDRAENTLALTIWAKRASQTALAVVAGNLILTVLSANLKTLDKLLTTETLERLSPEQLRDLSAKLKELVPRLQDLCLKVQSTPAKRILLSHLVNSVCEGTENLESTLENISFALRPGFNDTVASAIDRIRTKAEASVTLSY